MIQEIALPQCECLQLQVDILYLKEYKTRNNKQWYGKRGGIKEKKMKSGPLQEALHTYMNSSNSKHNRKSEMQNQF